MSLVKNDICSLFINGKSISKFVYYIQKHIKSRY